MQNRSKEFLEWVVRNCHPLTNIQIQMTEWHLSNGSLKGIGRPIGRMVYFPLIQRGKGELFVIDAAGFEQLAVKISGKCPKDLEYELYY